MSPVVAVLVAMIGGIPAPAEPPGQDRSYKPDFSYCNTRACDQRAHARQRARKRRAVQKRHKAAVRWRAHQREFVQPYNAKLDRIASCESGQRWHIATGNGFYGGLQFTIPTWISVGGRGMPHWHPEIEQKYRAVRLIKREGYGPWPVCGYV